nr:uncharacterized mitochondrial protein AtMg00810-like [Tanacetum cinerariifolium]
MRPFGCPVIILNTLDHIVKFNGKDDECFFVGYSLNSKAFRVFNSRTRIVEENLHIRFSEITPNVVGSGPDWLFDIDALTRTMNYEPIVVGTQSNGFVDPKSSQDDGFKSSSDDEKKVDEDPSKGNECYDQEKEDDVNITNNVNNVSSTVNTAGTNGVNAVGELPFDTCLLWKMKIKEEVYVCQPPRFEDLDFPNRVYKVAKALYGLHQAPRACQDKYVSEFLKKFGFTKVKTASTPMKTQKPLLKDEDDVEVDVYMYRSIIGSLMYLTSSRPDIMFEVYACARYQVNLKVLHLYDVKKIFRYLKGQPKLGLWYSKDSPFDLVAYIDSDYAGASLDRKSTTGGCQFFRCRLISWQCKKQIVVANSTTKAEYVAASSSCGQVLWIQNQLLDYGFEQIADFLNANPIKYALTVNPTIYVSCIEPFWSTTVAKTINGEAQIHVRVDGKKVIVSEASVRRDLQFTDEEGVDCLPNSTIFEQLASMGFVSLFLEKQLDGMSNHERKYILPSHTKKIFRNMRRAGKGFSGRITPLFPTMVVQSKLGEDEAAHKELGDNLVRAATTASSLEAKQDSGNINKTQSKKTPNESSSQGTDSSDGHRCQEAMGDTIAQTRFESVYKQSKDSLLARGNTLQSDEDRRKLNELMELCTNLQTRVIDFEKIKTTQANEIDSLKRRVKKLERRNKSRTHKIKRLYKGEGSGTPTEPHHTPSQEAQPSSPTHISTSSIPTSFALSPIADEPASPVRDVSEGEACPTDSGFIAD